MYLHYQTLTKEEVEHLYTLGEMELQEEIYRTKTIQTYKEIPFEMKTYVQNWSLWIELKKENEKYLLLKFKGEDVEIKDITEEYEENRTLNVHMGETEGASRINDLTQMWKDRFMLDESECKHHVSLNESGGVKCLNCKTEIVFC